MVCLPYKKPLFHLRFHKSISLFTHSRPSHHHSQLQPAIPGQQANCADLPLGARTLCHTEQKSMLQLGRELFMDAWDARQTACLSSLLEIFDLRKYKSIVDLGGNLEMVVANRGVYLVWRPGLCQIQYLTFFLSAFARVSVVVFQTDKFVFDIRSELFQHRLIDSIIVGIQLILHEMVATERAFYLLK